MKKRSFQQYTQRTQEDINMKRVYEVKSEECAEEGFRQGWKKIKFLFFRLHNGFGPQAFLVNRNPGGWSFPYSKEKAQWVRATVDQFHATERATQTLHSLSLGTNLNFGPYRELSYGTFNRVSASGNTVAFSIGRVDSNPEFGPWINRILKARFDVELNWINVSEWKPSLFSEEKEHMLEVLQAFEELLSQHHMESMLEFIKGVRQRFEV
jgi:hypothetical protein